MAENEFFRWRTADENEFLRSFNVKSFAGLDGSAEPSKNCTDPPGTTYSLNSLSYPGSTDTGAIPLEEAL